MFFNGLFLMLLVLLPPPLLLSPVLLLLQLQLPDQTKQFAELLLHLQEILLLQEQVYGLWQAVPERLLRLLLQHLVLLLWV